MTEEEVKLVDVVRESHTWISTDRPKLKFRQSSANIKTKCPKKERKLGGVLTFGRFGMGMWVCAFFIQFVCRMFYWNKSRVWVDWRTHSHMQHIICVYYQFILVVNFVCECEYCQNDIFCSYFAVFSVVSQPPPPPPPLFKLCTHIENNNNRYSCNQTVINHPHKKYAVRPFFTFDFNIWLQKCRHTHTMYTQLLYMYIAP